MKAEFYSEDLDVADLMDTDGSAFMIHDVADDYKTDPAGESGPLWSVAWLAVNSRFRDSSHPFVYS